MLQTLTITIIWFPFTFQLRWNGLDWHNGTVWKNCIFARRHYRRPLYNNIMYTFYIIIYCYILPSTTPNSFIPLTKLLRGHHSSRYLLRPGPDCLLYFSERHFVRHYTYFFFFFSWTSHPVTDKIYLILYIKYTYGDGRRYYNRFSTFRSLLLFQPYSIVDDRDPLMHCEFLSGKRKKTFR